MRTSSCTFEGGTGAQLAARLDLPTGEPDAWALFAHCFTCSKDLKAVSAITSALATENIATLRFDFTGLGESGGDFTDTSFSSNSADLVAAANYMAAELQAPSLLIGHSLGGAGMLHAASSISSARAVATIGAPSSPGHVVNLFADDAAAIERNGSADVVLAGRRFRISQQFIDDLGEHPMIERIKALDKALAIFHSPVDEIVDISEAARIFDAARHPKSFISLDHAEVGS